MLSSLNVLFIGVGYFSPQETLKYGPNNCLTNIFLDCEFFSTFYVEHFKSLVLEGHFEGLARSLGESPNSVKTIVSQTTSYIESFSFLC